MIATGMRLNFACGPTRWDGFENSDIEGGDVQVDLGRFPYPYEDAAAELVMMSHGIAGCTGRAPLLPLHADLGAVLREFHRILKPGGWLRIDDNPLRIYRDSEDVPGSEVDAEKGRGYPVEYRIDRDELIGLLRRIGFDPVVELTPDTTQIPCDGETRDAIVGNHGVKYSFALEAQK